MMMASSVEPLRMFSITLVSRFNVKIPVIGTPLCEVSLAFGRQNGCQPLPIGGVLRTPVQSLPGQRIGDAPAFQEIPFCSAGYHGGFVGLGSRRLDPEQGGRIGDNIGCGGRLVVADVVDRMLIRALQ